MTRSALDEALALLQGGAATIPARIVYDLLGDLETARRQRDEAQDCLEVVEAMVDQMIERLGGIIRTPASEDKPEP
jgi:hypothetical protein